MYPLAKLCSQYYFPFAFPPQGPAWLSSARMNKLLRLRWMRWRIGVRWGRRVQKSTILIHLRRVDMGRPYCTVDRIWSYHMVWSYRCWWFCIRSPKYSRVWSQISSASYILYQSSSLNCKEHRASIGQGAKTICRGSKEGSEDFDCYEDEEPEVLPCNFTYFVICILMHPVREVFFLVWGSAFFFLSLGFAWSAFSFSFHWVVPRPREAFRQLVLRSCFSSRATETEKFSICRVI